MGIKWGRSVLDFQWHAVDERADHPIGVFEADCGHFMLMVTTLHETLPGRACEKCAAIQVARAEQAQLTEE